LAEPHAHGNTSHDLAGLIASSGEEMAENCDKAWFHQQSMFDLSIDGLCFGIDDK
jgi:hypothetical protein